MLRKISKNISSIGILRLFDLGEIIEFNFR